MKKYFVAFLITVSIVFITFKFVLEISLTDGNSMYPTLRDKEIILSLRHCEIYRGDIIIAEPVSYDSRVIKRVIGEEGDRIQVKNGYLYLNGEKETEEQDYQDWEGLDVIVEEDSYYILGDNRNNSVDSRTFGTVSKEEVKGRVIIHFY